MGLINNHIYRFINVNYPTQALNVYGASAAASTGRNVCLYSATADPDDPMQKWKYKEDTVGKRLYSYVNDGYVLDRSSGITNSAANNAHLCATGSTNGADSALYFVPVSGEENVYRIRLNSRVDGVWRFLTAANNNGTTPASNITTVSQLSSANKNVYWAEEATTVGSTAFKKQCWTVVDLDSTSGGDDEETDEEENPNEQKLIHPFATQYYTVGYEDEAPAYPARFPKYGKHHAVDMYGYGSNSTKICASGNGVIVDTKVFTSLGNVLAVRYDNVIDRQGNNIGSVIVRYCHLASWEKTSGTVTKGEKIATEGSSGSGTNKVHLHMEFDTDTDYPLMTPTEGGGVNSTINPLDVLYKSSTQTVKPDCDSPIYGDEYDGNGNAWYDAIKIRNTPIA